MTFRIVLENDEEAKAFSAVCPELPGCASAGDTEEEAGRNIKEAIELYLKPSDIQACATPSSPRSRWGDIGDLEGMASLSICGKATTRPGGALP
jgi:predicted RNase H-like HicB family nuclease